MHRRLVGHNDLSLVGLYNQIISQSVTSNGYCFTNRCFQRLSIFIRMFQLTNIYVHMFVHMYVLSFLLSPPITSPNVSLPIYTVLLGI